MLTCLTAVSAQPESPADIILPYEESSTLADLNRQADATMLDDYLHRAHTVVIGQVVAVRPAPAVEGQQEIVTLLIDERLRGDAIGLVEFNVPLTQHRSRPPLIVGYKVLVFVDRSGSLIDGEGLFFLQAGFAWRNRTEDVFLRPSADRVWASDIDPTEDYIALSLDAIRQRVEAPPSRTRRWRKAAG